MFPLTGASTSLPLRPLNVGLCRVWARCIYRDLTGLAFLNHASQPRLPFQVPIVDSKTHNVVEIKSPTTPLSEPREKKVLAFKHPITREEIPVHQQPANKAIPIKDPITRKVIEVTPGWPLFLSIKREPHCRPCFVNVNPAQHFQVLWVGPSGSIMCFVWSPTSPSSVLPSSLFGPPDVW